MPRLRADAPERLVLRDGAEDQKAVSTTRVVRGGSEAVVANPLSTEVQSDGRVRHWVFVDELGKYLRVVTLEDGETIHNAMPDLRFKESTETEEREV